MIFFYISPFSTMTRFHSFYIHSGDYLVILYSFRILCRGIKIEKTPAINLLTSIDPS
ncbi:hypothetical protein E2C01_079690 [Portunus trituberculatus]|uniref:Uncharacterized protein n=1 Tax=Portunus trituberculatus TaxID=210409 RepID=A0A5B7ITF9_PORTR|nr:hypothetical protein [Portunus trituberculatus]